MFVPARPNTLFNQNSDNAQPAGNIGLNKRRLGYSTYFLKRKTCSKLWEWKHCNRPKIENRNGASEKTFTFTRLLRIISQTSVCVSVCVLDLRLYVVHWTPEHEILAMQPKYRHVPENRKHGGRKVRRLKSEMEKELKCSPFPAYHRSPVRAYHRSPHDEEDHPDETAEDGDDGDDVRQFGDGDEHRGHRNQHRSGSARQRIKTRAFPAAPTLEFLFSRGHADRHMPSQSTATSGRLRPPMRRR
ncbi:unnamed protein product [Nesidiocoris tenuis]|uniref:Uncharacterized protein n=1 Tax=Nesidiocoris tenuis TaxID=355587 RepID=A0A6H5FW15_9HEMI|nr:unnamed protein product [Nesidiocoris tenuis]